MEGARYLALNWSEEQVRASSLRRVIPRRRSKNGTRPGIRGEGPRGRETGDQEQWIFSNVVFTKEEEEQLIIEVLKIAVRALFTKHFYTFGGRVFKQSKGGPIGLRATCAIARAIMQLFDIKWEEKLQKLAIQIWLNTRYMDDGRTFLPPLKPGWRWENGKVVYCKRWEMLDKELEPEEITRRVLAGSMENVEEYLSFTTEVGGEFKDGWLPTLDTALRITPENKIQYKFYEKPEGARSTIQARTFSTI